MRRKKHGTQVDKRTHDPLQASTSKPTPKQGNNPSSHSPLHDDLDLPIVHKKGVRTCIQHPMSNFVSYDSLSPSFCSFSVALSFVSILHSVFEALVQLKWKNAMVEEMKALEKKHVWLIFPEEKNWWNVSGYSQSSTSRMALWRDIKHASLPKGLLRHSA